MLFLKLTLRPNPTPGFGICFITSSYLVNELNCEKINLYVRDLMRVWAELDSVTPESFSFLSAFVPVFV